MHHVLPMTQPLTPALLLQAYAQGIFPMAESAEGGELFWFSPPLRAVIPLDRRFHVARSLRKTVRSKAFHIALNGDFDAVIRACAEPAEDRPTTWINRDILDLYGALHRMGHAHSVEARDRSTGALVGGLYGVSLGGAFFGESMFSRATDASKVALVFLVALLKHSGFTLLDAQFQTPHLARFGTYEIERVAYLERLRVALGRPAHLAAPSAELWHHLACGIADGALSVGDGAGSSEAEDGSGVPLQPVTHRS